jgi:hypothetical protein
VLEDHKFLVDGQAKAVREHPSPHGFDMIAIGEESFDEFILLP